MKQKDYSDAGYYFVTICVGNRECVFGKVQDTEMQLNEWGEIAAQCWADIPAHFPDVEIDEFIVMPNHIHGIVVVKKDDNDVGNADLRSLQKTDRTKMKLSKVIHGFKSSVTRKIRKQSDHYFSWQTSFHDHIIRDTEELEKIQHYIIFNASKWRDDDFFVQSD